MGKVDITLNDCLKVNERYADCFNTAINYRLLKPEYLSDMERVLEGTIQYPKLLATYKKERDGVRGYSGSTGAVCAVVCLENQRDIDFAEVVRHFIYDAYSYNQQLINIRKLHVQEGKMKCSEVGGKYRGFGPEDRLMPVLTVCVYYGEKPWNAPTKLLELMDFSGFSEEERRVWREYIHDYEITVLDIRRMTDEQIDVMHSDLKLLFGLLKYSDDKDALLEFMDKYEQELSEIQDDLYQAMASLTNTRILDRLRNQKAEKGGKQDMCKAIDDLMKDCREEGRKEGRKTGRKEGERSGRRSALKDCILGLLQEFGEVPEGLLKKIQDEQNLDILFKWHKIAARADSIKAFEMMIL